MSHIQTITPLLDLALKTTKDRLGLPNAWGIFFSIDANNRIRQHSMLASTIFTGNLWTICSVKSAYQAYGYYTNYETFAIINKEGHVVNEIPLTTWEISKVQFQQAREPLDPRPVITFNLINQPAEKMIFEAYSIKELQQAWDFFLEIDKNCKTIREARIYMDFYLKRLENLTLSANIEEYKEELKDSQSVVNKYKELLTKLESMISNNATNSMAD